MSSKLLVPDKGEQKLAGMKLQRYLDILNPSAQKIRNNLKQELNTALKNSLRKLIQIQHDK